MSVVFVCCSKTEYVFVLVLAPGSALVVVAEAACYYLAVLGAVLGHWVGLGIEIVVGPVHYSALVFLAEAGVGSVAVA